MSLNGEQRDAEIKARWAALFDGHRCEMASKRKCVDWQNVSAAVKAASPRELKRNYAIKWRILCELTQGTQKISASTF